MTVGSQAHEVIVLDMKIMGSNPPNAGQLSYLATSSPWEIMHIGIISSTKEIKEKMKHFFQPNRLPIPGQEVP